MGSRAQDISTGPGSASCRGDQLSADKQSFLQTETLGSQIWLQQDDRLTRAGITILPVFYLPRLRCHKDTRLSYSHLCSRGKVIWMSVAKDSGGRKRRGWNATNVLFVWANGRLPAAGSSADVTFCRLLRHTHTRAHRKSTQADDKSPAGKSKQTNNVMPHRIKQLQFNQWFFFFLPNSLKTYGFKQEDEQSDASWRLSGASR